jgi:LemA protein
MTLGFWGALALLAVLAFWVIGARNRLVGHRNRLGYAWGKVQEALAQRSGALPPLVAALRGPLAAEQGALDAWVAAHDEAARAAAQMAARPLVEAHAQAWVQAEAALAAGASRAFALLEQHPALQQDEAVAEQATAWREGQSRLPFARQLFNDEAAAYNAAIAQFPTNLVARTFRMGPAGVV